MIGLFGLSESAWAAVGAVSAAIVSTAGLVMVAILRRENTTGHGEVQRAVRRAVELAEDMRDRQVDMADRLAHVQDRVARLEERT